MIGTRGTHIPVLDRYVSLSRTWVVWCGVRWGEVMMVVYVVVVMVVMSTNMNSMRENGSASRSRSSYGSWVHVTWRTLLERCARGVVVCVWCGGVCVLVCAWCSGVCGVAVCVVVCVWCGGVRVVWCGVLVCVCRLNCAVLQVCRLCIDYCAKTVWIVVLKLCELLCRNCVDYCAKTV